MKFFISMFKYNNVMEEHSKTRIKKLHDFSISAVNREVEK